jgi:hypothetical protein
VVDRPSPAVTAICAVGFFGAVFGTSLVASSASRDGRSDLVRAAKELMNELRSPRPDLAVVQAHLADGVAAGDSRVLPALEQLANELRGESIVANVRVTDGGARGETDILSARVGYDESPASLTLQWTRSRGGRWGYDPLSR